MTDLQQKADIFGMQTAEAVHNSGALTADEIQAQYDLIRARDARIASQAPSTPQILRGEPVGQIDTTKAIRGGVLFAGVLGVASLVVVTIIQVCAAAIAFIQAYSMPIGGAVVGLLVLYAMVSGRSGGGDVPPGPAQSGAPVINQTVIINK